MNASDQDLLREFARDGSEAAFAELVRRYLDLVFSAALRQLDSDVHAAGDVTQIVFTDLARKAGTLGRHTALTGWLYSSTRFEAIQHRRTEARRLARETAAHAMSEMLATAAEPDWSRLQPVLDEAMHDLPEDDRLAVLLRYFEKRPLAEIGTRLGLSENTARMRVERALDKLHAALKKRGITSTAAALGTLIGGNAIASVPAGLAEKVARTAAGTWQRRRPALAGDGPGWLIPVTIALLLGITGLIWMNHQGWFGSKNLGNAAQVAASDPSSETDSGKSANSLTDPLITDHSITNGSPTDPEPGPDHELLLKIITKDTGQPVPNVKIRSQGRWLENARDGASALLMETREPASDLITSRAGEARIRYSSRVEKLDILTEIDGFASMMLRWNSKKGDSIPTNYVLRLERAVLIGGRVLEPDDKPARNARVRLGTSMDFKDAGVEAYAPGSIADIDADGRWKYHRLVESVFHRVFINIDSEEYLPSDTLTAGGSAEIVKQLRDQTHIIRVEKGLSVEGDVVDESGRLLPGVQILWGNGLYKRAVTSDTGSFRFSGLMPITYGVSIQAPGYPPKNTNFTITEKMAPLRLVVDRGTTLAARLMDRSGTPITNAVARILDPMLGSGIHLGPAFAQRPDPEGRLTWTNALAGINRIEIKADGYIHENAVSVLADGVEHTLTLVRAPVIRGRVTDASTGLAIPRFDLSLGAVNRDSRNGRTNIQTLMAEGFNPSFTNGLFRHELKHRIASVESDDEYMVRFQAKGYRPQVSRAIRYDEGDLTLDVALEPAPEIDMTVIDPSGRPAAHAQLGFVKAGSRFYLRGLQLSFLMGGTPSEVRYSDAGGKLTTVPEPDVIRILAVSPAGYAETSFAALIDEPVIRLQAWGRIEGRFATTNSGAWQTAELASQDPDPVVTYGFDAGADGSGRFVLPQVPPGDFIVQQRDDTISRDTPLNPPIRSVEVTVEPGKTAHVTLGGGYRVIGRLISPAGVPGLPGTYWRGRLGMPVPEIPSAFADDPAAIERWARQPGIHSRIRRAEQIPVTTKMDGTFIADAVNPGTYRLQMTLYSRGRDGRPETRLHTVDHEVIIPEQPGAGEIDLGEVTATALSR